MADVADVVGQLWLGNRAAVLVDELGHRVRAEGDFLVAAEGRELHATCRRVGLAAGEDAGGEEKDGDQGAHMTRSVGGRWAAVSAVPYYRRNHDFWRSTTRRTRLGP